MKLSHSVMLDSKSTLTPIGHDHALNLEGHLGLPQRDLAEVPLVLLVS